MADLLDKKGGEIPQIDTIRNILFGNNMVEYQVRFEQLEAKVDSNHREVLQKMEQQEELLRTLIGQLEAKLSENIALNKAENERQFAIQKEAKLDRKQWGELLVNIGKQISA